MAEFNPSLPEYNFDVVKVSIFGVSPSGGRWQTKCYYRDTIPTPSFSTDDLNDFIVGFHAATIVEFNNVRAVDSVLTRMQAESLRNPALFPVEMSIDDPGSVTEDTLPPVCQATMQLRTATRGKHGRGRMQLPDIPETFSEDGVISGTGTTEYAALSAKIGAGFSTATPTRTWVSCLAYRFTVTPDVDTGLYTLRSGDLTAVGVRSIIGTQRRRYIGRGV